MSIAIAIRAALLSLFLIGSLQLVRADDVSNYVKEGAVIGGIDPVAYFVEMRPVAGNASYSLAWNGATWLFASAANRDAFAADPAKFAPQFGGYCALATAYGQKVAIDPSAFKIIDGKLYLNASKEAQSVFERDEQGTIRKANKQWLRIEHIPASEL